MGQIQEDTDAMHAQKLVQCLTKNEHPKMVATWRFFLIFTHVPLGTGASIPPSFFSSFPGVPSRVAAGETVVIMIQSIKKSSLN